MNRKILFKAKRKDNGEWVIGALLQSEDETYIATSFLSGEEDAPLTVAAYEVDPDTICQFTGLFDKNGQKIWENDIVEHEISGGIGTVKWYCEDYAGWCVGDIYIGEQQYDKEMWNQCEVIGNIFDNADLLEVE